MAEDGNGQEFVRVTNREVYLRLGEVEAKVDRAISQQAVADRELIQLRTDFARYIEGTDKRMRGLELRFYGILAGLIGVLGAIVAVPRVGA